MKFPKILNQDEYLSMKMDSNALSKARLDSDLHKARLKRFLIQIELLRTADITLRREEISKTPYIDIIRGYHKELERFFGSIEKLINED